MLLTATILFFYCRLLRFWMSDIHPLHEKLRQPRTMLCLTTMLSEISGISKTSDSHLHHNSVDKQLLPKRKKEKEREKERRQITNMGKHFCSCSVFALTFSSIFPTNHNPISATSGTSSQFSTPSSFKASVTS